MEMKRLVVKANSPDASHSRAKIHCFFSPTTTEFCVAHATGVTKPNKNENKK